MTKPKPRVRTILLVDDEADIRELVAEVMRLRGLVVVEAGNGAEALDALADRRHRFDLVVTDLNMPKLNGVDLVNHLRRQDFAVDVVVYSSDTGRLRNRLPPDVRVFGKGESHSLVNFAATRPA